MSDYLITGHSGLVGKEIVLSNPNVMLLESRLENYHDLCFELEKKQPKTIIHLAANVGGLSKNMLNNLSMFEDNLKMNINLLHAATTEPSIQVEKIVCFLSTCIYPADAHYPLIESDIHDGVPHDSNFGYAYAKRMLAVHGKAISRATKTKVICVIPNNLYGLNDNFHLQDGHVIPSIIHKVYLSKKLNNPTVNLWGDGTPLREFTFAGDIPRIINLVLEKYDDYEEPINIGNTEEYSIKEVAGMICKNLNYSGTINWDTAKSNGQHRKPSSNEKLLSLGWNRKDHTTLEKGLKKTCDHFVKYYPNLRGI